MTTVAEPQKLAGFDDLLTPLKALQVRGRVRVAFSGGLDSVSLFYMAYQVFRHHPGGFSALHINHQLQAAAGSFESLCRETCEQLGVELEVVHLDLSGESGNSLETRARTGRYRVFAESSGPGDVLLMAHHADDQAETILFRMLRGSGVRGLAGMPGERPLGGGSLVRPWLDVPRTRLEALATELGLKWVEDPSNTDTRHDRNYLRQQVIPRLQERWPNLERRLRATGRACQESAALASRLAAIQLAELSDGPGRISLTGFRSLPRLEQRNLLRHWCNAELAFSDTALDNLTEAAEDRSPRIRSGDYVLRRYRDHLYRVTDTPEPVAPESGWRLEEGRELAVGGFRIWLEADAGSSGSEPFHVRFRKGGEWIRPHTGAGTRPLKKWLQEQGVLPWERARIPLVFRGDQLIAVGTLWQAPSSSDGDTARRWRIDIRRDFD